MNNNTKYDIRVSAEAQYIEEQSAPEEGRYVFAYHITIENAGTVGAKLVSRHWIITDGDGDEQEVRGMGVVGEQPELNPGGQFEYTSGCALSTPVGTMQGSYQMHAEDGTRFDADIPSFVLSIPRTLH